MKLVIKPQNPKAEEPVLMFSLGIDECGVLVLLVEDDEAHMTGLLSVHLDGSIWTSPDHYLTRYGLHYEERK